MKNNIQVHYVCFFAEKDSNYYYFPSAIPKIEYIKKCIKNIYPVKIVSVVQAKHGYQHKKNVQIDENESIYYFSTFRAKNATLNKIDFIIRSFQLLLYLIFKVRKNDKVIIYHSLFYLSVISLIIKYKKSTFILQVEELYSAVTPSLRHYENIEVSHINKFSKLIVVNDLIADRFVSSKKKIVVCYGDYGELDFNCFDKSKRSENEIRIIYAGVIESARNAVFFALETLRLLPTNYKLYIAGFGSVEDINFLKEKISQFNSFNERIYYLGHLSGESYSKLLLNCDIGLSCHQYTEEELISADNSFPSKLIVYLKHNLSIVSNNLRCVKKSSVSEKINFFNDGNPQSAALVIKTVNLERDNTVLIKKLDKVFLDDLRTLLVIS